METDSGWAEAALSDVRPYTLTRGRTRPSRALRLTTCLIARPATGWIPTGQQVETLRLLCSGTRCSVAELSARMRQPVQVIKILASDLLDGGALTLASADVVEPDIADLERLLDGLRAQL